jgi:adenylyltransferase/sulfurtransferase
VGFIRIVEPDKLELSNLHRQVIYHHEDIGQSKAQLAKRHLERLNPHIEIDIIEERLTAQNVLQHFEDVDLVLDCTDNFETKYLINDAALVLNKPAVFASVYQWEGQLYQVTPNHMGGCLRCIWPEVPQQNCLGSCAETGILGVIPGMLGMAQAHGALMHLLEMSNPLSDHLVLFQLNAFQQQRIRRVKNSDCPACGQNANPKALIQLGIEQDFSAFYIQDKPSLVQVQAMFSKVNFIDLREPDERWNLTQFPNIPTSVLLSQENSQFWETLIPKGQSLVLYCQKGGRSRYWLETLRASGWDQLYAWTEDSQSLEKALESALNASLSRA